MVHTLVLLLGFSLSGFDRAYVASAPTGSSTLTIKNPFGARAIITVDGTEVGELLPKSQGTVTEVSTGSHEVQFELPNGYVHTVEISAT
jgi:hypothetical protein